MQRTILFAKNFNISQQCQAFSVFQNSQIKNYTKPFEPQKPLITNLNPILNTQVIFGTQQTRDLTKFSLRRGKRKSVKAVTRRFFRLNWGGWIRTRIGRHKRLWKKSPALRKRLKEHVFVTGTQSWLLDSMVTKYWRKPKYYVDDPYEPYHKREVYCKTRMKPFRP
ncbi:39S ribosomal protein L35, mitochondrial [Ctenocephalides felis]|uniref:39S ribosomal protein L35, mitochondrial n=1 Tax=Ctenocephalides felis TaxID=7515 RepID=UPI000E6E466E|nr:39S ribosomal protein L35, mitochondrial [Ctenocephalides felis]